MVYQETVRQDLKGEKIGSGNKFLLLVRFSIKEKKASLIRFSFMLRYLLYVDFYVPKHSYAVLLY